MPADAARDWNVDSEELGGSLAEPVPGSDQLLYRRHVSLTRRKRNILFPSGVKLCTQETFDQAVANHLSFFHLRGTPVSPGGGFHSALCCLLCSLTVFQMCRNVPFFTFSLEHFKYFSEALIQTDLQA